MMTERPVQLGEGPSPAGLCWRTYVAGLILAVIICFAGAWSIVQRSDQIGTGHLPRAALYPVLLFTFIYFLRRRNGPSRPETARQLLFLYCMILVMASIPGQRFAIYFYINLIGPIYYATPQNRHEEIFHGHIKDWLVPSKDPADNAVKWLFEGMPEGMGFFNIPWGQWVLPILAWMPLILGVLFVTLCISILLRKQWVEHERLLFPLAEVPLTLADQMLGEEARTPLFRNRLFWIAFVIPCIFYTVRCLHFYFPQTIPEWNLRFTTGPLFFESPWHNLNNREMNIYFDMVGIAYLLASEIGFSFWFFWFWMRCEDMARTSAGMYDHGEWRYNALFGGFVILFFVYFYAARSHFRSILRDTFTALRPGRNRGDALTHRFAFLGALLGTVLILAWCAFIGVSLFWAAVYFLFYFLILIMVSRIIAEAGLFIFWIPMAPQDFLIRTFGSEAFSAQTRTLLALVGFNYHDTASAQIPNFLQAYKIGTERRLNLRHLTFAMATVLVVSIFACHVSFLWALYQTGIPHAGWWWPGAARASADYLIYQVTYPQEPHARHVGYFIMGGAFTAFLAFMRQRFLWWPFHPLGYIGNSVVERHWFSIFVGWMIKVIIVQIGGVNLWRKVLPAAFGLILGNAFILFTWLCLHFIWPINTVLALE